MLWGGTLLIYLAVYDYAKGIFHPYYTVVMAPAVAALAGAGAVALWRLGRQSLRWAWALPVAIVGTALWADALLARTSGYESWVGPTVVLTGVVSALVLFLCLARPRVPRWFALAAGTLAVASLLAGPTAYSLTTLGTTTNGIATAGPTTAAGVWAARAARAAEAVVRGVVQAQAARRRQPARVRVRAATRARAARRREHAPARPPAAGGGASTVNTALVRYLEQHQGSATYLVAVNGSQAAAPFILESGKAVIAMGGFGGTDPAPTLREFEHLVATGQVHYVYVSSGAGGSGGTPGAARTSARLAGGRPTGGRGRAGGFSAGGGQTASTSSTTSAVDAWVEKHGIVVSSSAYGGSSGGGTLYYVSTSAATKWRTAQ